MSNQNNRKYYAKITLRDVYPGNSEFGLITVTVVETLFSYFIFDDLLVNGSLTGFGCSAKTEITTNLPMFSTTEFRIAKQGFLDFIEDFGIKLIGSKIEIIENIKVIPAPQIDTCLWVGTVENITANSQIEYTISCVDIAKSRDTKISKMVDGAEYSYPVVLGSPSRTEFVRMPNETVYYTYTDTNGDIKPVEVAGGRYALNTAKEVNFLSILDCVVSSDVDITIINLAQYILVQMDGENEGQHYKISNITYNALAGVYAISLNSALSGSDGTPENVLMSEDLPPTIYRFKKLGYNYETDLFPVLPSMNIGAISGLNNNMFVNLDYGGVTSTNSGRAMSLLSGRFKSNSVVQAILPVKPENVKYYDGLFPWDITTPSVTPINLIKGFEKPDALSSIGGNYIQKASGLWYFPDLPITSTNFVRSGDVDFFAIDRDATTFAKTQTFEAFTTSEAQVEYIWAVQFNLPEIKYSTNARYLGVMLNFSRSAISGQPAPEFYYKTVLSKYERIDNRKIIDEVLFGNRSKLTDGKVRNIPAAYFETGTPTQGTSEFYVPTNVYEFGDDTYQYVNYFGSQLYPISNDISRNSALIFGLRALFRTWNAVTQDFDLQQLAIILDIDIEIGSKIYAREFINKRVFNTKLVKTEDYLKSPKVNDVLRHLALLQNYDADLIQQPPEGWGMAETYGRIAFESGDSNKYGYYDYGNTEFSSIWSPCVMQVLDYNSQSVSAIREDIANAYKIGISVDNNGIERIIPRQVYTDPNTMPTNLYFDDASNNNIISVGKMEKLDNDNIITHCDLNYAEGKKVTINNIDADIYDSTYVTGLGTGGQEVWERANAAYKKFGIVNKGGDVTTLTDSPMGFYSDFYNYLGIFVFVSYGIYYAEFDVPVMAVTDYIRAGKFFGVYAPIVFRHSDFGDVDIMGFISSYKYNMGQDKTIKITARLYYQDDADVIIEKGDNVDTIVETGDNTDIIIEGN